MTVGDPARAAGGVESQIVVAFSLPADGRCSPSEAGAEHDEHDMVATFECAGAVGFIQCDGDGGGGGIAVFVEIDEDAFVRDGEAVGDGVDDAQVGLMGDHAGDVFRVPAGAFDDFFCGFLHAGDGDLEDLLALHAEGVWVGGDVFGGDWAG